MPGISVPEGLNNEEGNAVTLEDVDQDDTAEKILFTPFRDAD
jgi:hypothetical protein